MVPYYIDSIQPWPVVKRDYGHSLRRRVRGNNRRSGREAIVRTRRLRRRSHVHETLRRREFVRDKRAARHCAHLCAFRHTLHPLALPKCSRPCRGSGIVQCKSRNQCGSCLLGDGSHPECFGYQIRNFYDCSACAHLVVLGPATHRRLECGGVVKGMVDALSSSVAKRGKSRTLCRAVPPDHPTSITWSSLSSLQDPMPAANSRLARSKMPITLPLVYSETCLPERFPRILSRSSNSFPVRITL